MTDPLEDRLRTHFAAKAAPVEADADPGALLERAVQRSRRRRPLAMGAVVLAVVVAGASAFTGAELAGAGATASPAPLHSSAPAAAAGRAGVMAGPDQAVPSTEPAVAPGAGPYTLLFTRTTASGVTIRAYETGTAGTGGGTVGGGTGGGGTVGGGTGGGGTVGCTQNTACQPPVHLPVVLPCPTTNTVCAQPQTNQAPVGTVGGGTTTGSGGASSGVAGKAPITLPGGQIGSGPGTTVGPPTTVPPVPVAGCGQLVVELSTGKAVASASVARPTTTPALDTVEVLGVGSFGTMEGAPVGWVAAWVGSGVASVQLSSGGATVDAMTPSSGVAVMALPGGSDLSGATVVGANQGGTVVATAPAAQTTESMTPTGCPVVPPTTTTTTTTTMPTAPPTSPRSPSSTTTTTLPKAPSPTTTTVPAVSPPAAHPTSTSSPGP